MKNRCMIWVMEAVVGFHRVRFKNHAEFRKEPGPTCGSGQRHRFCRSGSLPDSQDCVYRPGWQVHRPLVWRPLLQRAASDREWRLPWPPDFQQDVHSGKSYSELAKMEHQVSNPDIMREQRVRANRPEQGAEVLLRLPFERRLHHLLQPALRVCGLASLCLPLLAAAQSPESVELKPGFAAAYRRIEGGKPSGELGIWAAQDAVLLRFQGSDGSSYRLLRSDGSLYVQSKDEGGRTVFFGKPLVDSPFDFPFQWAGHSVLGVPKFQSGKNLVSWLDIGLDPRRDRQTTGEGVFDTEGRVRSLTWPASGAPLGRLTVSGWTELVIESAPTRVDLDLQLKNGSKSIAWELIDDAPPPRPGSDFTFEGLIASRVGESKAVPVADCRVVIESCPVLIFQPGAGPLLNQLGTAGHGSLKERSGNPALMIILFSGTLVLFLAAAKKLMSRKAKDGVPSAPS